MKLAKNEVFSGQGYSRCGYNLQEIAMARVAPKKGQKKKPPKVLRRNVRSRIKSASAKKVSKNKKPRKLSVKQIQKLVVDHYETGRRLAWSFLKKWRVRIEDDEVTSITGAALCEAANRFRPDLKVNFNTFLFYHLRGMLLKEISKRVQDSKHRAPLIQHQRDSGDDNSAWVLENLLSMDDNGSDEFKNPEELLEKKQLQEMCRNAAAGLDDLERSILDKYFKDDESVGDIAKSLGYCRCHISRVKSTALNGMAEKLQEFKPEGEELDEAARPAGPIFPRRRFYKGSRGRRRPFDGLGS